MKDFLMTSGIPYWLLFILTVASVGYCAYIVIRNFSSEEKVKVPKGQMLAVSVALLLSAVLVIVLYATLGGGALWWVTNKEIGYWSKLLRVVPLMIYLIAQGIAPFAYMLFMAYYFGGKRLSVRSQFIAIVVIVPVALIVTRFFNEDTRDMWLYIIAGAGIAVAAIYSVFRNTRAVGLKSGLVYTVTSFVLCAATLITLLYFIVAFFSLILEMLPVIAVIIGVSFIFGKSFGNAMMQRDDAGNYIAADGSKHSSQSARDVRNQRIQSRRNP